MAGPLTLTELIGVRISASEYKAGRSREDAPFRCNMSCNGSSCVESKTMNIQFGVVECLPADGGIQLMVFDADEDCCMVAQTRYSGICRHGDKSRAQAEKRIAEYRMEAEGFTEQMKRRRENRFYW